MPDGRSMIPPGELVRSARLARGFTQAELAEITHTAQSAINRLESGRIDPAFGTVRRILACMGYELSTTIREKA